MTDFSQQNSDKGSSAAIQSERSTMAEYEAEWGDGATQKADRRQTHVEKELGEQPELISAIQQAVNEIEKRLNGVLRGSDDPEKAMGEPRPVLVPIAETLNDHNGKLRWIHARLVSVLDRLEL